MNICRINYNLSIPKYNNKIVSPKPSSLNFSSQKEKIASMIDEWKKEDKEYAWSLDKELFYKYTYGNRFGEFSNEPDLSRVKEILNSYKNDPNKLKKLLLIRGDIGNLWSGARDIFYNGDVFFDIKKVLFDTAANLPDKSALRTAIMKPNKKLYETIFAYEYDSCKYTIPLALRLVIQNKNAFSKKDIENILNDINNNKTLSQEFKNKAKRELL